MTGTPTDMRTLMQDYVSGLNRPTKHVDICLDPKAAQAWKQADEEPVSYTHLTLPTKA